MAEETHQYNNIALVGKLGIRTKGNLKISPKGIGWKSAAGKSIIMPANDLSDGVWVRIGSTFQIRISTKDGSCYKLDGFKPSDRVVIDQYIKEKYGIACTELEMCTRGWNWGDVEFTDSALVFLQGGARALDLPLGDVSQVTRNKNDITVEFHQDDTLSFHEGDALVEMKVYVPPTAKGLGEEDSNDPSTTARNFHKNIKKRADIVSSGKSIVTIESVQLLALQRGRYDIEMYATQFRLRGKTYDYTVSYSSIFKLFLLPKPDEKHMVFACSLDPPIRHGHQMYQHILMQFNNTDMTIVEPKSDLIPEKLKGKIQERLEGYTYDVICDLFKIFTGQKISGCGEFLSSFDQRGLKCSVKANDGFLYPLDRGFFFIHKPPIYVAYSSVSAVEFTRVNASSATSTRSFDLIVYTKDGNEYQFNHIQRQEYSILFNFIVGKGLTIKGSVVQHQPTRVRYTEADSDDSEDEDFAAVEEEDVPEEYDENYGQSDVDEDEDEGDDDVDDDDDENFGSDESDIEIKNKPNKDKSAKRTREKLKDKHKKKKHKG